MPFVMDKSKSKALKNLPYLAEFRWGLSDLHTISSKLGLSILSKSSKYLEVELKASIISV